MRVIGYVTRNAVRQAKRAAFQRTSGVKVRFGSVLKVFCLNSKLDSRFSSMLCLNFELNHRFRFNVVQFRFR